MRQSALLLLLLCSVDAWAGSASPAGCQPRVASGWVRMAPAAMPMGAAFAVIDNPCAREARITGVQSQDFSEVSLHETRIEQGISRMRAVPALVIPPRRTTELRPGGLHVMLMRPTGHVEPGRTVRVEFVLADGRRFGADLPVRDRAP